MRYPIIIFAAFALFTLGFFAAVEPAQAALTFSATTVSSDGALTLTGAAASTWDAGGALSLQTTNNGAITTGSGKFTSVGLLHVAGTYNALGASPTSSRVIMGNTSSFDNIASLTVIATSSDASAKGLVVKSGGASTANVFEVQDSNAAVVFGIVQGAGGTATTTVADSLVVDTSSLVVYAELNRVGIGTALPATTLEVMGTASTSVLTVGGTGLTATTTTISGGMVLDVTTLVVNANENRIGVLTATPQTTLEVVGTASTSALTVGGTGLTATTTTVFGGLNVDSNTLVVNANENRVGVGNVHPTSTLSVSGSLKVTGDVKVDSGTGSVATNAVTINAISGVITDSTNITASSTRAAITLTNSYIAATSVVLTSICSTPDANVHLEVAVLPGAGSATLTVGNSLSFDQTSDYKICFLVVN